jgi:hypothetical protein
MSISYFILKNEIYGQTAGARGLCITPPFLVGGIMVAVAPATSDEVADGMDHFEVKVDHTEVSGSPSCRWSLVGIIMPPATPSTIGGPNGTLLHYGEGATVDAPVAFISDLSNGTYKFKVQALNGTSIVATGSVTLEILDIYWQTSCGSSSPTVNGSIVSSVYYPICRERHIEDNGLHCPPLGERQRPPTIPVAERAGL